MNRDICSVLESMKNCDKTKDYSRLGALIAEAEFLQSRYEQVEDLSMKKFKELVRKTDKKRREYDNLWLKCQAMKKLLGEKTDLAEELGIELEAVDD